MKRPFLVFAALGAAAGAALAFSLITGFEFHPDPPVRSLPEAYAMALKALGPATNEYYCVSAMRSNDSSFVGGWLGGWDFTFDRNYMQHKLVYVVMKPYETNDLALGRNFPGPLVQIRDTGVIFPSTNGTSGK